MLKPKHQLLLICLFVKMITNYSHTRLSFKPILVIIEILTLQDFYYVSRLYRTKAGCPVKFVLMNLSVCPKKIPLAFKN